MKHKYAVLLIAILMILACCQVVVIAQTRTTPVEVQNSPVVKIDSTTNEVKAQQNGTWNVGISSTANTVSTPASTQMFQCWETDQVILSGGSISWNSPNLAGYREARCVMMSGNVNDPLLKATIYFRGGLSGMQGIGSCNFIPAATGLGIITQANFSGTNYQCAFTVPLMSPYMSISVYNNSTLTVTISRNSWVYVVN
jgi:hypothetical protein